MKNEDKNAFFNLGKYSSNDVSLNKVSNPKIQKGLLIKNTKDFKYIYHFNTKH